MKKKISFHNIGCRTNIAEIEEWIFELDSDLFEINSKNPDFIIVNTCSVTSKAAGKSRGKVNKLLRDFPEARIVIAGCSVDNRDISVDGNVTYIKNSDKDTLFEVLNIPRKKGVSGLEFRTRQNVIIQTGCNSRCSYCIIPFLRGNESSRNIDNILSHVKELFNGGIKEIVLTGTNIGRYKYNEFKLYELLLELLKITPENSRIRLSSIEPWDFDERIIRLVKNSKQLCPFFHIPLQSGNKRILKDMNRNYSLENFDKLVSNIKKEIPDAMVGTDIIAGFPNETEDEFLDTKEYLMSLPVDHFHVFSYSPRRGTVAEKETNNNVPNRIKKKRVQELLNIGKEKKTLFLSSLIGKKLNVIIEKKIDNSYIGKAENFADVVIEFPNIDLIKGNLYSTKIISVYKNISLKAELNSD